MPLNIVVGTQWGDEGKGKIVDYLASSADCVVRFNGGNNAGHTVVINGQKHAFHILPSGAVSGKKSVIANGTVIDPAVLLGEIKTLRETNPDFELYISDRAHVILPYHKLMDGVMDDAKGKLGAGTTRRGIGPAYADKMNRIGVRICDLLDEESLREKIAFNLKIKRKVFQELGIKEVPSAEQVTREYAAYGHELAGHVTETVILLNDLLKAGATVLGEGAHGMHLDIDHGIYPFNTSSNIVAGNVNCGAGIPVKNVNRIIGTVKAYTTRVGTGPVPTELDNEIGQLLREKGGEYGTTTHRPRRCGWLDLVLVKHSNLLNGLTGLAVTKLDVLAGLDEIKVCTHYEHPEKGRLEIIPADMRVFARCRPVYRSFESWSVSAIENLEEKTGNGFQALPVEMQEYLRFIESETGVPVEFVSYGADRKATIRL
ncbi:MAG: adenylosuccinate synthase [Candidatus Odinarchaeota archaeon]